MSYCSLGAEPGGGGARGEPREGGGGGRREGKTNIWGLDHMPKLCLVLQSSAALEVICQAAHGRRGGCSAGGGGREERGRRGRGGGRSDPTAGGKEGPGIGGGAQPESGGSGWWFQGKLRDREKRSRREIEVKEEESRVDRGKRENEERGTQTGRASWRQ